MARSSPAPPENVLSCFRPARVGLGAFGVITAVTWQNGTVVPSACRRTAHAGGMRCSMTSTCWSKSNEHLDAYWWPHTRHALLKCNNRVDLRLTHSPARGAGSMTSCSPMARSLSSPGPAEPHPRFVPALNRLSTRALPRRSYSDVAHRVFTSPRRVRFVETEWALPRSALVPALRELADLIERGLAVGLPLEIRVPRRTTAGSLRRTVDRPPTWRRMSRGESRTRSTSAASRT